LPPPTPLPSRSSEEHDRDLSLPVKPLNPAPPPAKGGTALESLTPPQLPSKWTHSANGQSQPTTAQEANKPSTPDRSLTVAAPQVGIPEVSKPKSSKASSKSSRAIKSSSSNFAVSHTPAPPTMSWQRPQTSEESEPKAAAAVKKAESSRATPPSAPSSLPTGSTRRWKPAYQTRPASNEGTPGVIIFDDDPPPSPPPAAKPAAMGTSHPIVPAELQRRVKSACGWQARDVVVLPQNNGGFLVKVKVPNLHVEDQLTKKILAIPEMTAPGVRLVMDVGP
jgi:hypothetical protein